MVEAHFINIVAISSSVFFTMKSERLRRWTCVPLWCICHHALAKHLRKCLPPLVYFRPCEKILQINLSLFELSVCLISLCPSLIGLCACLISLSPMKPISTGLFEDKLVKKHKVVPDCVQFYHKL